MIPVLVLSLFAFASGDSQFFDDKVAPILLKNCMGCHNADIDDGHVSFEDRTTLFKPRKEKGPAILPGKPEQSPLVQAIRHNGNVQMPPGRKLSDPDIAILTEWVKRGAAWGTKIP